MEITVCCMLQLNLLKHTIISKEKNKIFMINPNRIFLSLFTLFVFTQCESQSHTPFLSNLNAGQHFPIYTSYAAAIERSAFTLDEGYRLQYDVDSLGADFITDNAGDIGFAFQQNNKWIYNVGDMNVKPMITLSYPDMVVYHYYPVKDICVEVSMVVHSSNGAFWQLKITNESKEVKNISVASFIHKKQQAFKDVKVNEKEGRIYFTHVEEPDGWTRAHHLPMVENIRDLFQFNSNISATSITNDTSFNENIFKKNNEQDSAHLIAFRKDISLQPQASDSFRVFRIVQPLARQASSLNTLADSLNHVSIASYKKANEILFSKTPLPPFKDSASMTLYWSACNMMRQVFYPPEGNLKHNYYVFSREPQWGWGHGGQVFHESIAMLAYAYIDPVSAMNSQRVFADRQHDNGYINYRTGSYLDEVIEYKGQLTSSAPWYAWLNWEVYSITKDKAFLKEMYESSKRFYNFYTSHRDADHDGLCEWGGEAVLESVRDGLVAVWDQVGYPAEFEALDLNCMLVMEAKSLEKMAATLGLKTEAAAWKKDYQKRALLINKTFWDPVNHFYYNVDKKTHSFSYKKKDDLKRNEIIGFLPLWAGIADKQQASYLVKHLTDTASFWRRYGVPSLAANDPYYNPRGYWNGPVWIQWNYLIERGLLDYDYKKEAVELVHKVMDNMIAVLKSNHELWEFYDPDKTWGGYHRTYIWAGIINRMMMDIETKK